MIEFTAPEERIVRSITHKVNEKVNEKVNDRVNEKERELLLFLMEDPAYTVTQLADKMNVSRKTAAFRLKALKDKGIIGRVGSDRKGYWKINELFMKQQGGI